MSLPSALSSPSAAASSASSIVAFQPRDPFEAAEYSRLWALAHGDGDSYESAAGHAPATLPPLSGKIVVEFFLRTGVDKGYLKGIWNLAVGAGTSMDAAQFNTALRYVTLIQRGYPNISQDLLLQTIGSIFELPVIDGIIVQRPLTVQAQPQMPPPMTMPIFVPVPVVYQQTASPSNTNYSATSQVGFNSMAHNNSNINNNNNNYVASPNVYPINAQILSSATSSSTFIPNTNANSISQQQQQLLQPAAIASPSHSPTLVALMPEWSPNTSDSLTIKRWFSVLESQSTQGAGFVGGAAVVAFLKTSNLNKDLLRNLWADVDRLKRGYIDEAQFFVVVRLVSLGVSPLFAGRPLNMEFYHSTAGVSVPLASLGGDLISGSSAASATSSVPSSTPLSTAASSVTPNPVMVVTSIPIGMSAFDDLSPPAVSIPIAAEVNTNRNNIGEEEDDEFSDFSGAASSTTTCNDNSTISGINSVSSNANDKNQDADDDDDFGDFATPVVATNLSSSSSSSPSVSSKSADVMSAFDLLAPIGGGNNNNRNDSDDFSEFSTASSEVSTSGPGVGLSSSSSSLVPSGPPLRVVNRPLNKGEKVYYQKDKFVESSFVTIVGVHKDDFPNIYYSISFEDGREKQTDPKYLAFDAHPVSVMLQSQSQLLPTIQSEDDLSIYRGGSPAGLDTVTATSSGNHASSSNTISGSSACDISIISNNSSNSNNSNTRSASNNIAPADNFTFGDEDDDEDDEELMLAKALSLSLDETVTTDTTTTTITSTPSTVESPEAGSAFDHFPEVNATLVVSSAVPSDGNDSVGDNLNGDSKSSSNIVDKDDFGDFGSGLASSGSLTSSAPIELQSSKATATLSLESPPNVFEAVSTSTDGKELKDGGEEKKEKGIPRVEPSTLLASTSSSSKLNTMEDPFADLSDPVDVDIPGMVPSSFLDFPISSSSSSMSTLVEKKEEKKKIDINDILSIYAPSTISTTPASSGNTVSTTGGGGSSDAFVFDDHDFGDFETVVSSPSSSSSLVQADSTGNNKSDSNNSNLNNNSVSNESHEDDFGDFGDFGDFTSGEVAHGDGDISNNADSFPFNSGSSSTSTTSAADAYNSSKNTATLSNDISQFNRADSFVDLFPEAGSFENSSNSNINSSIGSNTSNIKPIFSNNQLLIDQLLPGIAKLRPTSKASSSAETLHEVAQIMFYKNFFASSALCIRQVVKISLIKELMEKKRLAADNEEFEAAAAYKNEITKHSSTLAPYEDELKWFISATVEPADTSLEELLFNLSRSLSSSSYSGTAEYTEKMRKKLTSVLDANNISFNPNFNISDLKSTEARLCNLCDMQRQLIISNRLFDKADKGIYCRQDAWAQLLDSVRVTMDDCIRRGDSFDRLPQAERSKILASPKLATYVNGMFRMAQAGIWIVATCFETQLLENESLQFLTSYEKFNDVAQSRWKAVLDPLIQKDIDDQLFNINHLINLNKSTIIIGSYGSSSRNVTLDPISLRPIYVSGTSLDVKSITVLEVIGGDGTARRVGYFQFTKNLWERLKPTCGGGGGGKMSPPAPLPIEPITFVDLVKGGVR